MTGLAGVCSVLFSLSAFLLLFLFPFFFQGENRFLFFFGFSFVFTFGHVKTLLANVIMYNVNQISYFSNDFSEKMIGLPAFPVCSIKVCEYCDSRFTRPGLEELLYFMRIRASCGKKNILRGRVPPTL